MYYTCAAKIIYQCCIKWQARLNKTMQIIMSLDFYYIYQCIVNESKNNFNVIADNNGAADFLVLVNESEINNLYLYLFNYISLYTTD